MCTTCGCSDGAEPRVTDLVGDPARHVHAQEHDHEHEHPHAHGHDPHHHGHDHHPHQHQPAPASIEARREARTIRLEQDLLAKNDQLAERNRRWLDAQGIVALNLMSSPGAGKTTLLERTIHDLRSEIPICVIEGDQETSRDAERIRATGCHVVQINTGSGCHLDADMLSAGVAKLAPPSGSLLLIENVGNLVCPALFDLGERAKVVIMSVAEGEDKPVKYPHMFRASDVMVLNKLDLLPHVHFDVERCIAFARQVNPRLEVVSVSATRGDGLDRWYGWLRSQRTF